MSYFPTIKTIDIETAPNLAYTWGLWKQNIGKPMLIERSFMLSYVSKNYGEDEIQYGDCRYTYADADDYEITVALRDLLNETDFVIGHNFKKFDLAKIKGRIALHGIEPHSPVKVIDTLTACRRFGYQDNTLETMTKMFKLDVAKSKHDKYPGFSLWAECLKGNMDAWDTMIKYNIDDVVSNELLYDRIKPYIEDHPSFGIYEAELHAGRPFCTFCGSENLARYGYRHTNLSKFRQYKCGDCGKYPRGRTNLLDLETRQGMTARVT